MSESLVWHCWLRSCLPGGGREEQPGERRFIFTLGSDRVQTVWPNAHITLRSLTTRNEVSTVSDVGTYAFTGLLPGEYEVTVSLGGFETLTEHLTLKGGDVAARLDFPLALKKQKETVNVIAEPRGVDAEFEFRQYTHTDTDILKSAVRLARTFRRPCRPWRDSRARWAVSP